MSDLQRSLLKSDLSRGLNRVTIRAILGDGSGRIYDSQNPNSGYVWVQQQTSNGYSTAQRVRGPYQGAPVQMIPGNPVVLKLDTDGQLFVAGPDFQSAVSVGINPNANNASDENAKGWTNQSSIVTLVSTCTPPPSLSVLVRGWMAISNLALTWFPGGTVDLTALVPTAGNQCIAVIVVKSDYATLAAYASTAKDSTDVLGVTDIQEALNAAAAVDPAAVPIWAWRLHDAQTTITDKDSWLDLRQFLNLTSAAETKLATVASVDMNTATATTLYTVPTGRSCIITKVVVRNASTSLTTASYSFGFNSAPFNDVIADATHTELTGSTLYTALSAKAGAKVGVAADNFKVLMNTLQGGAATTTMDVFGYLL